MLLYLFIWEHFISRIIEYSFHKVTHQTAIVMVVLLVIMLAIGVSISVAVGLSSRWLCCVCSMQIFHLRHLRRDCLPEPIHFH